MNSIKNDAPIIIGHYPFHERLVDELVPLLENYEDKQNRYSNVKATMTEWNITTPRIKLLQKFVINEIVSKIPGKMVADTTPFTLIFRDFWANVYRKGDYALPHNHLPAIWSFVYFLKSKWFYSPLIFDNYGQKIKPKNGRFVVFPSLLIHSVPKHRYGESRMTLSGNVYYDEVCKKEWLSETEDYVSLI